MYTIIGSGFGLYGYLPAIIEGLGGEVVLPNKYYKFVCSRSELAKYRDKVKWVANQEISISKSHTVIIAVPPMNQKLIIKKCLEVKTIKSIFLEKPLAPSSLESAKVLDLLNDSDIDYAINYSFIYIGLLQKKFLSEALQGVFSLKWNFMAHHYISNIETWKRKNELGGGALRFYGIHIIALLAYLEYKNVINSELKIDPLGDPYHWIAEFSGPGVPNFNVSVNTRSDKTLFEIDDSLGRTVISRVNPFQPRNYKEYNDSDYRVQSLTQFLQYHLTNKINNYKLYKNINNLWQNTEAKMQ
jgi:predicted dehydrogenase